MGAPNPDVTALVQQLALQHWTVANTPDLSGVVAAVTAQLSRLGGEINDPVIAFASLQVDQLFAQQEALESSHGDTTPTIVGNVTISGSLVVSANSSPLPAPQAGTVLRVASADGANNRFLLDDFGGLNIIVGRLARGTAQQPLALIAGSAMLTIASQGYGATKYGTGLGANIEFVAEEGWTDTAQGSRIVFFTTTPGTLSSLERFRMRGDGGFTYPAGDSTGMPGNATINLATGRSAIAAGAATVTITNSLVGVSSIPFAVLQTNDATAILKNVVPGAGSFVVNLTAAATANTNFGWWVIN